MDIKIKTDNVNFTYRTAAIIINENKILMQRNKHFDFITLPGGKCSLNETSEEAIVREIKEELGLNTIHLETKGIIENFFFSDFDKKNRHELLFISKLQIISEIDYSKNIINSKELKYGDEQYFEWINLSDLNKYSVEPKFILEVIKSDILVQKIHRD